MALRHAVLPKTLHAERRSTHVDWEAGAPGRSRASRRWRRGTPRRAWSAARCAPTRGGWAWPVRPDVVLGHSVGEIAAAHGVGILSLPDACDLGAARGGLMDRLPPGGAMVAIVAPEAAVLPELAGHEGVAGIAAVNAPSSVVVSGPEEVVTAVADALAAGGARTKRLPGATRSTPR
ncbi:acyltransferase domain-containing protein [Streptomyces sp. PT12]|uniref:acyltransferase domain-containing protein n=1 Tax=Streptomyces sp. PT12 TaxID=1510197 RepID=UPI0034D96817